MIVKMERSDSHRGEIVGYTRIRPIRVGRGNVQVRGSHCLQSQWWRTATTMMVKVHRQLNGEVFVEATMYVACPLAGDDLDVLGVDLPLVRGDDDV